MKNLDIKQESFFPPTFKGVGVGLIIWGLSYLLFPGENGYTLYTLLWMSLCLVPGVFFFFTRYGLTVNVNKKQYRIYTELLGLKFGNYESFNSVEKFYVNKVKAAYTVTKFSGAQYNYSNYVYKAYMLLDNGEKIHLDTDKKEERLQKRVEKYQKALQGL